MSETEPYGRINSNISCQNLSEEATGVTAFTERISERLMRRSSEILTLGNLLVCCRWRTSGPSRLEYP